MFRKIKYLFGCIIHMDYKSLFAAVKKAHKLSGKNSIYLFFDIVFCGFKYGAGYMDYMQCEFYKLNKAQRKTYVTRGKNTAITRLLNNQEYYHFFDFKNEFYDKFSKFLGREWIKFDETDYGVFEKFMENRDEIICKPLDLCCGDGVEKLYKKDYNDVREMYETLKEKGAALVEDVVKQHPKLNELYDKSVNTLRIVTVYYKNKAHIVFASLKIGNSDRPIDNINAGGISVPVDIETGMINYPGSDLENNIYEKHPKTGCKILGFQIPCWEKAKAICLEAAAVIPEMGYIGWDVAITDKDEAIFIEGNNLPGYGFYQMPEHLPPDRIGILPKFKEIIDVL